jgi:hypothetical protein
VFSGLSQRKPAAAAFEQYDTERIGHAPNLLAHR